MSWCLTLLTEFRVLEYQNKKKLFNYSVELNLYLLLFFCAQSDKWIVYKLCIFAFYFNLRVFWSSANILFPVCLFPVFSSRIFLKLSLSFTTVFDLNIKHFFLYFLQVITPSNCYLAFKFKQLKFEVACLHVGSTHC